MSYDDNNKKKISKKDMISSAVKKELSDSVKDKKSDSVSKKSNKDEALSGDLLSDAAETAVSDIVQRRRNIIFSGLVLLVLILAGAYFLFMNPWWKKPSSDILLSQNPINSGALEVLRKKEKFVFNAGTPIYVFFQWENPLKKNEISISVYQITARSKTGNRDAKEKITENIFEINNLAIDRIYTLIQDDFFDNPGDYEMIIKSGSEILDKRAFAIVQ